MHRRYQALSMQSKFLFLLVFAAAVFSIAPFYFTYKATIASFSKKISQTSLYVINYIRKPNASGWETMAPSLNPSQITSDFGRNVNHSTNVTTTILVWYPPFGKIRPTEILSKECGSCEITGDVTKVNDPGTKAVVFHFKELDIKTMPKTRKRNQFYVWWAEESSHSLKSSLLSFTDFDGIFNLTMSYRRDSDIYGPYGTAVGVYNYYKDPENSFSQNLDEFIKEKSKMAIWIVSNCNVKARNQFFQQLTDYGVTIDIFGRCFNAPFIPFKKMRQSVRKYKFYFAFENRQHCRDYITEKFFLNALELGAVPVVWGASKDDYDSVAPPGSYIHSNDYSVKDLAAYLIYLHHNDTAYQTYHMWRTLTVKEMPLYGQKTKWCQLCSVLNPVPSNSNASNHLKTFKVVSSIQHWLYDLENPGCLN